MSQLPLFVTTLIIIILRLTPQPVAAATALTLSGCQTRCGGVQIPYPFGIGAGCFLFWDFEIKCIDNTPYFVGGDAPTELYRVLEISIENSTVRVDVVNSPICESVWAYWSLWTIDNFRVSPKENVYTVVGCNVLGLLNAYTLNRTLGCISTCPPAENGYKQLVGSGTSGSCNGIGCCEISPGIGGPGDYQIDIRAINGADLKTVGNITSCYRAFFVEKGKYIFSGVEEEVQRNDNITQPVVVDWFIGGSDANLTCDEARKNKTTYACVSVNHVCEASTWGGYVCKCEAGYQGNPYVEGGCKDIDECSGSPSRCAEYLVCVNLPGSFDCILPEGSNDNNKIKGIAIGLGIGLAALILIAIIAICYVRWKKQARRRERQRHSRRNNDMLKQQLLISSYKGDNIGDRVRFFTLKEMKNATNNFDTSHVVGQGGHGTVYKGLVDLRVVAIKKSKVEVDNEITDFLNEIILLSQISHRNVVKLIGCCFETEVPLLVYEFISNGTLFDHIHTRNQEIPFSWDERLRIATEISGGLAYLHSAANISIFHRDMKSSNILLDDKLTAKISDFGASKFVKLDQTHVSTDIQGTFGYLDPEYVHTGQLTDKSDVYSLGVILVELLTGEKPTSRMRFQEEGSLVAYFMKAIDKNRLFEVVEGSIVDDDTREEIEVVATLAVECLRFTGKDRPTMKDVEVTLGGLRKIKKKTGAKDVDGPKQGDIDQQMAHYRSLISDGDTSTSTTVAIKIPESFGTYLR